MATTAQANKRSDVIQQSLRVKEDLSLKDIYGILKRVIFRTLSSADDLTAVAHNSTQVLHKANTEWATVAIANREDSTKEALKLLDA